MVLHRRVEVSRRRLEVVRRAEHLREALRDNARIHAIQSCRKDAGQDNVPQPHPDRRVDPRADH